MAGNQDQGQRGEGQTVEQQRAAAQQQGGRLQSDQQAAQQRSGGQQAGNAGVAGLQGSQRSGQQGQQAGQDQAQQARRQVFDEQKRATAERPQQSGNEGSQPTPTQQENDEISAGLRHIDDKEDDRSGADPKFAMRRIDADETRGKYETR